MGEKGAVDSLPATLVPFGKDLPHPGCRTALALELKYKNINLKKGALLTFLARPVHGHTDSLAAWVPANPSQLLGQLPQVPWQSWERVKEKDREKVSRSHHSSQPV